MLDLRVVLVKTVNLEIQIKWHFFQFKDNASDDNIIGLLHYSKKVIWESYELKQDEKQSFF